MSDELLIRAVENVEIKDRTFTGRAMKWGEVAHIRESNGVEYQETFAPNSIVFEDKIMVFSQHKTPVGIIEKTENREDGFYVTGRISSTRDGDDVLALLRDGVITGLSIGFSREGLENNIDEKTGLVTRLRALVKEVSLVSFPAFKSAKVLSVREATDSKDLDVRNDSSQENKEIPMEVIMNEDQLTDLEKRLSDEITNVREESSREIATAISELKANDEPVLDQRSAAEVLKGIVEGDELAIRTYTGGTSADAPSQAGWVGDLTRIIDEASVIRSIFSSGSLPAKGMTFEYAQLLANTSQVTEQEDEGDDLDFGKVSTEIKSAPVKTFGGYTTLSRQEIERSSIAILQHSLRAQAIEVGKRMNAVVRAEYLAQHALQVTANNTVEIADPANHIAWLEGVVDAAIKFQALGLPLDALLVDEGIYKALLNLEANDGRPLFVVSGVGSNTVGHLDVRALKGDLASLPVVLDPSQTTSDKAAFINSEAIRTYTSPAVQLQDENVINLSKDFSVYVYGNAVSEIPAAIVPVELGGESS